MILAFIYGESSSDFIFMSYIMMLVSNPGG